MFKIGRIVKYEKYNKVNTLPINTKGISTWQAPIHVKREKIEIKIQNINLLIG
jgi:hypothetical protein